MRRNSAELIELLLMHWVELIVLLVKLRVLSQHLWVLRRDIVACLALWVPVWLQTLVYLIAWSEWLDFWLLVTVSSLTIFGKILSFVAIRRRDRSIAADVFLNRLSDRWPLAVRIVLKTHICAIVEVILSTKILRIHLIEARLLLELWWVEVALWIHHVVGHSLHTHSVILWHLLLLILVHWILAHLRHHTARPVWHLTHLLMRQLLKATNLGVVPHVLLLHLVINLWLSFLFLFFALFHVISSYLIMKW